MNLTAEQVINLGLGKIAASRISSITPPRSALERHCASGYAIWRDSELVKRTWRFALETSTLTKSGDAVPNVQRPYKYPLPNDCLRPLRDKRTEWQQRGNFLWSAHDTLTIDYIRRAKEAEFPAEFVEVLASRVAQECAEFATQSNTKLANINKLYEDAVNTAGRVNAFVIGPEDVTLHDDNSEWLISRWG